MKPCVLSIAGSDSSGGAGIQADLKTFHQLGVCGTTVITCLTAQNTTGVQGISPVEPDFVVTQLQSVVADMKIAAVKTGMLFSSAIIRAVGHAISEAKLSNLVVDPVMVATSGDSLLENDAVAMYTEWILPAAVIVTPNTHEAAILCGRSVDSLDDMQEAAIRIAEHGPRAVLVKGGHMRTGGKAVDLLYYKGEFTRFEERSIEGGHEFHGSGCTLSAAIAAFLASGMGLVEACGSAKKYVHAALKGALNAGRGSLILDHWARF